ncbi:MAG: class I SAM-dependent methyltransferase [Phenylobacterium sp.]|uniref:class I SAM-dependent methyltransferase n=1 Tax=Phenylobacterium sp. TaxID=1871053 RepID=UPI002734F460|nr:class I SAM-dependent methyltransferase [Phenylobacterium sp.]MDP3173287.1 class I SAM-dependent methyltransferase [Phenylobacterium sp.]
MADSDLQDLDFDHLDPAYRGFIDEALAQYGLDPAVFCTPVPAADEMTFKALLPNYEFDRNIGAFKFTEATLRHFDAYDQIVRGVFGGFERLNSVLDFASGYGRLTRILIQKLPRDRIWVSDIYAEAVDWQAQTFGVNAFASSPDPALLDHAGGHDLVFVGSMFSHLPAGLFHDWLAKLYGFLGPRGVLAFSVHDEALLPAGESMDATGLRYFRASESGSLDADIYGMSYVTEAFVADAIARVAPGVASRRFPKGLYENQDLYVVGTPGVDLQRLVLASTPMGGLETITLLPTGEAEFAGWAIERTPGQRIERIGVLVDGAPAAEILPATERPDVLAAFPCAANTPVGWRFRLSAAEAAPGARLRLQLQSTSGLSGHVFAQMPAPAAMTYSGWSRRALRD